MSSSVKRPKIWRSKIWVTASIPLILCSVTQNEFENTFPVVLKARYAPSEDFYCWFQTTVILNNLAKAYAESGRYELAEEMAREAVRIAEKTNSTHLSRFMANLGAILNLEGISFDTFVFI